MLEYVGWTGSNDFGTIWSNSTKEISSPVPRNFVPEDWLQASKVGWAVSRSKFLNFDKDIIKENNRNLSAPYLYRTWHSHWTLNHCQSQKFWVRRGAWEKNESLSVCRNFSSLLMQSEDLMIHCRKREQTVRAGGGGFGKLGLVSNC